MSRGSKFSKESRFQITVDLTPGPQSQKNIHNKDVVEKKIHQSFSRDQKMKPPRQLAPGPQTQAIPKHVSQREYAKQSFGIKTQSQSFFNIQESTPGPSRYSTVDPAVTSKYKSAQHRSISVSRQEKTSAQKVFADPGPGAQSTNRSTLNTKGVPFSRMPKYPKDVKSRVGPGMYETTKSFKKLAPSYSFTTDVNHVVFTANDYPGPSDQHLQKDSFGQLEPQEIY